MTRYRQDRVTGKLHEIKEQRSSAHHFVQSDIEPFTSHVDGSHIRTRRDLVEHNKRNGVSNDPDSLKEQAQRANAPKRDSRAERYAKRMAIKDAIERTQSSGFVPPNRRG